MLHLTYLDIWVEILRLSVVQLSILDSLEVAAPAADAELLANLVTNLFTETVPARGLEGPWRRVEDIGFEPIFLCKKSCNKQPFYSL